MGASHGNAVTAPHQAAEKIGALEDGNTSGASSQHFRIIIGYGRGSHDQIGAGNILRLMTGEDGHTGGGQTWGQG